jgi:polyisoprenoid-binding protein YceI
MKLSIRKALAAAIPVLGLLPALAADTWQIDPAHSSAGFSVTHLMISTVRGEFGAMTGTIVYDGKDVSSIKVDATIDAASVTTRNDSRDTDLRSDHFFDVKKFPTLTFKSKKVVVKGPSHAIKGMRGETRVAASATAILNRMDYGMSFDAKLADGGLVVSNDVAITIDIEAVLPPAGPPPPKK